MIDLQNNNLKHFEWSVNYKNYYATFKQLWRQDFHLFYFNLNSQKKDLAIIDNINYARVLWC
jgi:hypothetical protein